ncbi:Gfo/Idh/MocA family oxidoreductase [Paenibacillus sp. FSL W7-1287]|uniref:Gfo/Idh/MocA family oxidoreductase n=1 Tax=Paenibacillus sp. FSL W7-1287 TaxID=2954538 RepID=UPI0030F61685
MSLKIGMIGTDSSHTVAFARIINDQAHPFHVAGGKITHVVRTWSADFQLSYSREERFSSQLFNDFGIPFAQMTDIGKYCDAFMLEAADGRKHLELFKQLVVWNKPIFIDKPLAIGVEAANEIIQLSKLHNVPVMSSSALRYSHALNEQLSSIDKQQIRKVTVKCPLIIEPTQSRYYWYVIHGVEVLYAILGAGCIDIAVAINEHSDVITGIWSNEMIGEIVCAHDTTQPFEVIVHTENQEVFISLSDQAHQIPYYASLLEEVMLFFTHKTSPISYDEMLEVVSFIEKAEQQYKSIT